jgi:glycosyltransferase involved in cell wall biosynthesis
VKPHKITVVHNGVEPIDYLNYRPFKNFSTDKIVSFLGRITMQKGPGYFVDAANLVIRQMKNVRFVMGGQGDLLDEIKRKVSLLHISGYFHFPGFISEDSMDEFFGQSDVFVMPSVSEPFGIVALEAMQAEIPVIVSKQSGVSEVVKNVVKVDYWDTKKMADSILYLIKNHNVSIKLAQKGKQEAQKMAWKTTVAKIYGLYQKLIKI